MKKSTLITFISCILLCFVFTSCNKDLSVNDITAVEQTYNHTELAEKMYSPEFLEGKGEVVDGELVINVNLFDALTDAEIASIEEAGALYIDKSFNISYEDAVKIWGEDAPIPAEGISFESGEYTSASMDTSGQVEDRGCWVCQSCGCGVTVCTYYDICIIVIIV